MSEVKAKPPAKRKRRSRKAKPATGAAEVKTSHEEETQNPVKDGIIPNPSPEVEPVAEESVTTDSSHSEPSVAQDSVASAPKLSKLPTVLETIHPSGIYIPERQRKEFPVEQHNELRNSIRDQGLFHAIGLRENREEQRWELVYGHRRLLATTALLESGEAVLYNQTLYKEEIPFVNVGDLTDLEIQEIELHENTVRLDLPWQERAKTVASIQALRNKQREHKHAEANSELPEGATPTPKPKPVTLQELAEETSRSTRGISEDLAIARHLDDPDVAKAKTQKEARKIIEKKAKQSEVAMRTLSFKPSMSQHTLLEGDCREQIKTLPDKKFTAVVTDPPYGIDMHKDLNWDGHSYHEYDDTEAYCFNLIAHLLPEWDRVTKDEAHLYLFCDITKFPAISKIISDHGVFDVMPYPFIWNKGNIASFPRPDHWPRKSYETILYAVKGDKTQAKLDHAVIDIPQVQGHPHPAGKPASLYSHLIKRSALPGDEILDCFAGQGTIFAAASQSSTVATGIEMSEKYITLAKDTLTNLAR